MEYLLTFALAYKLFEYLTERSRAKSSLEISKLNHEGGEKARMQDTEFVKANTQNLYAQRDIMHVKLEMFEKGYYEEGMNEV